MIIPLVISSLAVLVTFIIATVQDIKTRTVVSYLWYPAFVIGVICVIIYWVGELPNNRLALILSLVVAAIMVVFSIFGLFGKADAKALILLSLTVPVTPFVAWIFPSLALSSLINAGILSLIVPVSFLIYNAIKKNKAPFWIRCSGFPVKGEEITKHHGFIAEDIKVERNGTITRSFRRISRSVNALSKKSAALHTRKLRENPEEYKKELENYRKCDKIWLNVGIPFMLPITVGYVLALFGISAIDLVLQCFL